MIARVLPLLLLLASCITSGPTIADTAADRQAFNAVRAWEASATHTPEETAAHDVFMQAWNDRIAADEAAAGKAQTPQSQIADLIRIYGLAIVQAELEPAMQAKAPEMFRLLDRNGDGHLDQTELLSFNPSDPVAAVVIVETGIRLLKRHK